MENLIIQQYLVLLVQPTIVEPEEVGGETQSPEAAIIAPNESVLVHALSNFPQSFPETLEDLVPPQSTGGGLDCASLCHGSYGGSPAHPHTPQPSQLQVSCIQCLPKDPKVCFLNWRGWLFWRRALLFRELSAKEILIKLLHTVTPSHTHTHSDVWVDTHLDRREQC